MYTNCPECGTVFRISTNELRMAEGNVRCGHCSATFNALETLADELPPTVTLKQLTLPTEPGTGAAVAPEEPELEPEPSPADVPGFPTEPASPASPPELQVAASYVPLPISEDTLEFDIPEDSWSNFFDANGPAKDAAAEVGPEQEAPARAQPDRGGGVDTNQPAHSQTDVGTGIGSETVDQAGLYRALSVETGDPGLGADGDWQALLEEVLDDEASPEPVYVIDDEPRTETGEEPVGEPVLPEASWDDPLAGGNRLPAPLPADFATDLPDAVPARPEPGPEPALVPDYQPFLWKPPTPPAPGRSGRHWAYTAGSVLLALALLIQVLHQQRDDLATHPALTEALQRTYAALGLPLWPAWDLRAYELRNSEAVADRSNPGALDILARIAVVGSDPVGMPLVRVTLRDRLSRPLGSRVFQPEEYLGEKAQPRKLLSPGTLIPVEISLQDPGTDAQGFDVDVCVMNRREGIVCRVDREPFVR